MRLSPAYRTLRLLRQNGDVSVYDAWSLERGCRCVAKVLRGGRFDRPAGRRALRAEGTLLLSLSHPHIVRGYELLEHPRVALIMETLPGETLSHLLRRRGGLAARDVAMLGRQLCSALHYLHGVGVLHLDVKPSNVVCHGGIARLLDLGIARPPGRGVPGIGTAAYMAPEQARGGLLTAAADVFSLGAVLFEAVTGSAPFRSDGDRDRYEQLERRATRVRAVCRVPAALSEAIDASLEPEPARRPPLPRVLSALERVTPPA
ncbi:serine/threonine-protein kinase [Anaeromyxobacter terrae]|uniref:serine/threonine-protein kinase n=1 Tax=Anaeromyxobacter terrae TaxID=2925406 RepID=UPI001F5A5DA6|nr:serine/threonine-protein kinase [Anaeromyxobacter sp. SG22]